MLDLKDTFKFIIIASSEIDRKRADYTYNEVLRLNEREFLRKARKNAYINYKARLHQYLILKNKNTSKVKLTKLQKNLKEESHPTVWHEMQRYHCKGYLKSFDKELDNIFFQLPESLNW
jgi:hypothetical protein